MAAAKLTAVPEYTTNFVRIGRPRKRGTKPNPAKLRRNLLVCLELATKDEVEVGKSWYRKANQRATELACQYGHTPSVVCGVIAALSPGASWETNLSATETLLEEWGRGARGNNLPLVGSYGRANIRKAERILMGEPPEVVLRGPKTLNFWGCLAEPNNPKWITVDRHMKCAAHGEPSEKNRVVRAHEYSHYAESLYQSAQRCGLLPSEFQAIVWTVWRRLQGYDLA